jgi:uncharacterized membrane protein
MRGLACIVMFQTHCYDAWLGGASRDTGFLKASQVLGTIPAPIFLFLAGFSFALVTDKLLRKNLSAAEITRFMVRRGREIFAFGLLFRLQEYLIAWGWAPWSDLLRVDVLNIIGLSMILMALLIGISIALGRNMHSATGKMLSQSAPQSNRFDRRHVVLISLSAFFVAIFALLTPLLYTTWRPTRLPWFIESYIDGCHNLGSPQPWLFPLFPWAAFAFAGLGAGFIFFATASNADGNSAAANDKSASSTLAFFGATGIIAIVVAQQLDRSSFHLYSTYDYWHTSPNFLMMRVGLLLVIAFASYAWCRWGWATRGFSPLIQLGQTSLLVYWVHIEFVYGRFSIMPKRAQSIPGATRGLLEIILFMLLLSMIRTRFDWKNIDWKKFDRKSFDWKKMMPAKKGEEAEQPASTVLIN